MVAPERFELSYPAKGRDLEGRCVCRSATGPLHDSYNGATPNAIAINRDAQANDAKSQNLKAYAKWV